MLLGTLVQTSAAVGATAARLAKVAHLAALLRQLPREEVDIAIAFLSGGTRQGRIGLGGAAIRSARDVVPAGEATLTLTDVDHAFTQIAAMSGRGSTAARVQALGDLLGRATRDEQDFLVRLLFGELRQGALEAVLVDALAKATGVAADRVRRAVMMAGDAGPVAHALLTEGEAGLAPFRIQPFTPIQPMLAETAGSAEAAVAGLGEAALEYKLDGARVQAHKAGDEVRVFSRHLRELDPAPPEVIEAVRAMPARELILDGEALALRADGMPHPFQVTMKRFGKKAAADPALMRQLAISPFFFDLLYADGASTIDEPLSRRVQMLDRLAPASARVPRLVTAKPDEADRFLEQALAAGHEGIMAKALASPYAAGRRGAAWLKIKQAHTLDLVVLAAEWGSGRRRGWLSNLHLGARGPDNTWVMLGKTFKGLTDEMLAWQTAELLAREIGRDDYTVYVRPELVVEIAFNDIQASPIYPGGLALRFARVKRHRDDKPAAQADTIETVRQIYTRATGLEPPSA